MLLLSACAWKSFAQPAFDSSGDGQLNGAYYMRQVFYFVSDQAGDLGEAVNIQGTITFNGSGAYSFSGSILDTAASSSTPVTFTTSGSYVVSASGEGYISGVNPTYATDQIIGLVSHGIFIGSTTENSTGYNDLFIATPVSSTPATNATFNGSYAIAYFDPTFGTTAPTGADALLTLTANGQGNIGTVNVTGYVSTNTGASTQTLNNVTYSFSNGAAQLNFGGTASDTTLIGGTELLYISPDGNFIFGGSYNLFDIFVGVRAATSNPSSYDGLYYQAGLDLDETSSGSALDSYFGSLQAFTGNIIGHQREFSLPYYEGSSDFTYYDAYTLNGDGSSTDLDFSQYYLSSSDGSIRIGYGIGPYLSLNVALMAPSLTGSGVYLSPVGVVNAASSAPFTAFISPGEFLTLYGSGLAPTTTSSGVPFPDNLAGVQVMINDVAAPIYYVSPTQISVVVPYIINPLSVAQIQVINNGSNSNVVTQFTGETSVGAFTNTPEGGIGYVAALHPDYSIVSPSSPAQIGETIAIFVAGMGPVNNQPADGTAASSTNLSTTTNTPDIYLTDSDGNLEQAASPAYSGLAPGLAGLYQINFTMPTGLVTGPNASIEIFSGVDSDTVEALIPFTTSTSSAKPADKAKSLQRPHVRRHRMMVQRQKSQ
ncbi:MAG: hypothetical protein ABSE57_13290 [Bryobacteraceae bacterium]